MVARKLLHHRTWRAHWPQLRHLQLTNHACRLVSHLQQRVAQRQFFLVVRFTSIHSNHSALHVRRTHDPMLGNQLVLVHTSEHIASRHHIALLEVHGLVQPLPIATIKTHHHTHRSSAGTSAPRGINGDFDSL